MASGIRLSGVSGWRWKVNRVRVMGLREVFFRTLRTAEQVLEEKRIKKGWSLKPCDKVKPGISLFTDYEGCIPAWLDAYNSRIKDYEGLLEGNIQVFNAIKLSLKESFDWHRDPETGRRSPLTFGKKINYRDSSLVGNAKVLWELGRHQHLVPLSLAYAVTNEEGYISLLTSQINEWIAQNPFGRGIHWCSALEVALRLISWAFIHSFLSLRRPGGVFSLIGNREQLEEVIYQHAYFIQNYFSRHSSANNHLIGELVGLWISCNVFDLGKAGKSWKHQAKEELEQEAIKQVWEDGVNKEQAVYYHLWVLEYLFLSCLVGERVGNRFSEKFYQRILAMTDFLEALRPTAGTVPQIGDSDDGYVIRFEPELPADPYSDVMSSIRAVLVGASSKTLKLSQKAFWYYQIGERRGVPAVRDVISKHSRNDCQTFPQGGYAVLSDEETHLVFDAGPLGYLAIAAHGHADALSFCLALGEHWWLVDPGTYCYHTEPEWRAYFRGTAAHNTIVVDRRDQSIAGGPFLWTKHAQSSLKEIQRLKDDVWLVTGSHDGYVDLGVRHERTLEFNRKSRKLVVQDRLEGKGEHDIQIHFHFAPEVFLIQGSNPSQWEAMLTNSKFQLQMNLDKDLEWKAYKGSSKPRLGWYSRKLGHKEPCFTLQGSLKQAMPLNTRCIFSWYERKTDLVKKQ